ncbi:hypothetical protein Anas_00474 [Armadillidium nasatum]|uniref:LIM zinc-binding domain-containing protein n=1 Tax=Armadillidium nasatum TaxID=96803 RepID=A0A5N5TMW7_9CRUS|nr:hypothetical protein Anas_00474 [Armadillidium nasatum]
MVMRARNNVYHLECFACQQCNHSDSDVTHKRSHFTRKKETPETLPKYLKFKLNLNILENNMFFVSDFVAEKENK